MPYWHDIITTQYLEKLFQKQLLINDSQLQLSNDTLEIRHNTNSHISAQTIIIDQQRGIVLTSKTTRTLINQLINNIPFDRAVNKWLRNHLNCFIPNEYHLHERLPLILGNWCFLPLNSNFHRCANWIALHHLKNYELCNSQLYLEYDNGTCSQIECHCTPQKFDDHVHEAQCMQQHVMQWINQLNQLVQSQTKPCRPYKCQRINCPRCQLINEQLSINKLKDDWLNHHYQTCLEICHQIGLDHWHIDMFKYHYHQKYFKHRNFD